MKYVTKINQVTGIGTTIKTFIDTKCVACHLLCEQYHLQHTGFNKFSPQTYHQINGEHSLVYIFQVEIILLDHNIVITIEKKRGDLPLVHNAKLTTKEKIIWIKTHILIGLLRVYRIRFLCIYTPLKNCVIFSLKDKVGYRESL